MDKTPATERQMSYINSLRRQLGMTGSAPAYSKSQASRIIEDLRCDIVNERMLGKTPVDMTDYALWAPVKPEQRWIGERPAAPRAARSTVTLDPGMYRTDAGTVYRVQLNRNKTGWYAKRLTPAGLEYAGRPADLNADAHRMTLDEAKAAGKASGQCCVCGAELTDPKSVDAGIGPVCAGRV